MLVGTGIANYLVSLSLRSVASLIPHENRIFLLIEPDYSTNKGIYEQILSSTDFFVVSISISYALFIFFLL